MTLQISHDLEYFIRHGGIHHATQEPKPCDHTQIVLSTDHLSTSRLQRSDP